MSILNLEIQGQTKRKSRNVFNTISLAVYHKNLRLVSTITKLILGIQINWSQCCDLDLWLWSSRSSLEPYNKTFYFFIVIYKLYSTFITHKWEKNHPVEYEKGRSSYKDRVSIAFTKSLPRRGVQEEVGRRTWLQVGVDDSLSSWFRAVVMDEGETLITHGLKLRKHLPKETTTVSVSHRQGVFPNSQFQQLIFFGLVNKTDWKAYNQ